MATAAPKRRLKPEQRRKLIVDAAAEEFGRRGHRDARMEDIARAAGVTKAVLYDHFPSKGALHAEVVSRANQELLAAVAAATGPPGPDPETRFYNGLVASFRIIAERADVRTLLLGEPGLAPEVARASLAAHRSARVAMASLYLSEPSWLRGHPRRREKAEHIAQAGIGLVNALAALGVEKGLAPEKLADLAMEILWPGIWAMRR